VVLAITVNASDSLLYVHRVPRQIEVKQDSSELEIDAFATCRSANEDTWTLLLTKSALGRQLGPVVTSLQDHNALARECQFNLAGNRIYRSQIGREYYDLLVRILSPQDAKPIAARENWSSLVI